MEMWYHLPMGCYFIDSLWAAFITDDFGNAVDVNGHVGWYIYIRNGAPL